ncbi:twin-arginine translocation signal domain-containing protein [Salinibaculum salinum]|uniref:twin-arginine translocation signal domain-containing protein n=1 Tax=Salinibaculum salinum TaxID=3131996 RepID=UPI0030ED5B49
MKPTRRQFLAAGAVAGAGALAGCEQIPFIGGDGGIGQFTNWVPAAGEIEPNSETVNFNVTSPTQIHSNRTNLRPSTYQQEQQTYRTGVQWQSLSMSLSMEGGAVYKGSYNADDVAAELTSPSGSGDRGEFTEEDSEGNYDIFIPSSANGPEEAEEAWAVSGNAIISARPTGSEFQDNFSSAVENAKAIIDVGENGENRAVDDSDDFNTLANEFSGAIASGRTLREEVDSDRESIAQGNFEGMVASGASISINGSNSNVKQVFVFDSEGDVSTDDLEEYVERSDTGGGILSYARDVNVNQNGTAGIVNATIDTYDIGR